MNYDDVSPLERSSIKKLTEFLLGRGAYGKVYQGVDTISNKKYAIKEFFISDPEEKKKLANEADKNIQYPIWMYGLPKSLYQEIKLMKEVNFDLIVPLVDIFIENGIVHTVMPLMNCDLKTLLTKRIRFTESQMKCLILDIAEGLHILHSNWFLHRDITPGNIFVTSEGKAVLADYGMSVTYGANHKFSVNEEVVTLWYRPPELLFKADLYQDKVDIWSFGCIFAEILLGGVVLFNGTTNQEQLGKIFNIMGTPGTPDNINADWPEAWSLPNFTAFEYRSPTPFSKFLPNANPLAIELLTQILQLNPNKRLSAAEIKEAKWFKTAPFPSTHQEMLTAFKAFL